MGKLTSTHAVLSDSEEKLNLNPSKAQAPFVANLNNGYKPGVSIGLLGGGQLGMMLCQAAIDLGIALHVLDPDPDCSCHHLAHSHTVGSFKDYQTVLNFGRSFSHITVEIEAVNTDALKQLVSEGVRVYPKPEHLDLIKDKSLQKQFYKQAGIPTSDFVLTQTGAEVLAYPDFFPAVHKSATDGYDGRGVVLLSTPSEVSQAFDCPAVLEKKVDIQTEFSIIISRNELGQTAHFEAVEQVFHATKHILQYLVAPASIPQGVSDEAIKIAHQIVEELDYVGLLAVEFFLTKAGAVLVNEIAPRPHNSGHHTIRACRSSQFEQHLRAVLGLPSADTSTHSHAAMLNILGAEGAEGKAQYTGLTDALSLPGVYPFLYGKSLTRPFRKMGHVTVVGTTREEVLKKAEMVIVEAR